MLMLAAAVVTLAPHAGKPSPKLVERIEESLSHNRCVKPLSRWHRNYAYSYEGRLDIRYVDVWFIERGHDNAIAGRYITQPEPPMLDDSQFRLVSAKYEIATGRFMRFYCGLNLPDRPADWNGK